MKIRVDFTIEVHPDSLDVLRELAQETDLGELRSYVRGEAEDALRQYLEMNGVNVRRMRGVYGPGEWAWQ
jgi:hypothetical protein